jgi:predicted nucleic acid-binding protein
LILDTNALSAVANGEDSAIQLVAGAERLAVPVIVLGEYRLGTAQSRQKAIYETWLRQWIAAVLVLDIDEETTHSYAAIGLELKKTGQAHSRQRSVGRCALPPTFSAAPEPGPALRSCFRPPAPRLVIRQGSVCRDHGCPKLPGSFRPRVSDHQEKVEFSFKQNLFDFFRIPAVCQACEPEPTTRLISGLGISIRC